MRQLSPKLTAVYSGNYHDLGACAVPTWTLPLHIFPAYITTHCISYGCPSFELGHTLLLWQVGRRLLNFSHHAQPLKIKSLNKPCGSWTAPRHESASVGPPPFVQAPAPAQGLSHGSYQGPCRCKGTLFPHRPYLGYLWRSAWRDAPYFVCTGGHVFVIIKLLQSD